MLKEHPPIKFLISISGSKFRDPSICDIAYKDPIKAKSVHFIGDKDWLKLPSEDLASAFDKPLIIRHPQGHTVPRLGMHYAVCYCSPCFLVMFFTLETQLSLFHCNRWSVHGSIKKFDYWSPRATKSWCFSWWAWNRPWREVREVEQVGNH